MINQYFGNTNVKPKKYSLRYWDYIDKSMCKVFEASFYNVWELISF